VDSLNPGSELHKSSDDETLSRRESDVLEQVIQKLSNKQIAKTLFITPETVKWHLSNIYRKLGVTDRRRAALIGRQLPQSAQVGAGTDPTPIDM
jgi:LuxR family maltose regulon positive regulatory protein